jgi:hypothetical protein
MVAIASLGKFMANSRLASVLGVFSNFTLTRVTKEGYTKSSRLGYRWYKVGVGFKQQTWQAFTN